MFKKNAFSTLLAIGALLAITFGLLIISKPVHAGPAKVEVCHVPPDDPDNFHTITVSENALSAHIAHFDLGGACDSNCAELCDDGDMCTYEDTGDCQENGCPIPQPVVCGEGQVCDPELGCVEVNETCPCFTLEDLQAQGAYDVCSNPFPGTTATAGVIFSNGNLACSGPECNGTALGCGFTPAAHTDDDDITVAENQNCQDIIAQLCGL